METLVPRLDAEHRSLFEIRIKAITASCLGVFGSGAQLEHELIQSIRSKSPEAADRVEAPVSTYLEACQNKAPNEVIERKREKTTRSSKELWTYVRNSNCYA